MTECGRKDKDTRQGLTIQLLTFVLITDVVEKPLVAKAKLFCRTDTEPSKRQCQKIWKQSHVPSIKNQQVSKSLAVVLGLAGTLLDEEWM